MVALRYTMKNASGEVLADTMEGEPAKFLYGSGEILPGLENFLTGLKIGDQKSFSVSGENTPGLNDAFHFDIVIDNIWWPENKSLSASGGQSDCGPDCAC